ncbi:MAG: hypothetical protein KKF22_14975 [Gammaproteobacteria bacterium]|nr:hypothetical protein [Gammaproteobacteria bacterium]
MDTETYQLIDTALKIGLGALITGASGYLLLLSKQSHETRVERRKEHVSTLRDLAIKIERVRDLFDQATHPYWLKVVEGDIEDVTDATKLALNKNKEALSVLREVRALCALLDIKDNVALLDEADTLSDAVYQQLAQKSPFQSAEELNSTMKKVDNMLMHCLKNLAIEYANV